MDSAGQRFESLNIQLLVDSIPALIHTARPDGYLDYFNKPWLDYLGATLDDVTGWKWWDVIHPEDVEGIVAKWRACLATGEIFECETRVRRANGEYRWMFHRKLPLRDADGNIVKWYGSSLDIDERKTAEAEFRQIVDLAPQLVGVYGSDLEPLYANRMALDYHGVRLDDWRQMSRGSATHPDDSERVKATQDSALASGSAYEVELRLRKHDGSYRWFLARYNPVRDDKGQITRWYITCTDIEDRKQGEERLRSENVALREEIDKASMF